RAPACRSGDARTWRVGRCSCALLLGAESFSSASRQRGSRATYGRAVTILQMGSLEISPDEFQRLAEQVTELTADYLREMDSRPIPPPTTGAEVERLFCTPLSERGVGAEALAAI